MEVVMAYFNYLCQHLPWSKEITENHNHVGLPTYEAAIPAQMLTKKPQILDHKHVYGINP
jgi:hypothetical protein